MQAGLMSSLVARTAADAPLLELLGTLRVGQAGTWHAVANAEARLLAFLALRPRGSDRDAVARALWPGVDHARAAGNLRSAVWRAHALPVDLLAVGRSTLSLRPEVLVDVRLLAEWAARLISGQRDPDDLRPTPWDIVGVELLPGWQDPWLVLERERVRQRLLHGLECLAHELIRLGRCAEAVEVALIATDGDALRESSRRSLIEAHLAEGNWSEARRCFCEYRELLADELGVAPSARMAALVRASTTVRTGGSG
jgi:DNA-binding SARP family transcriptional activator